MSETDVSQGPGATVFAFDDLPWQERPGRTGTAVLRGKYLAQGEGGFYVQHVEMPPGYEVAPHSHTQSEVIVILDGGCSFGPDRLELGRYDTAVLLADHEYGFDVGNDGMRFLIVRQGEAVLQEARTNDEERKDTHTDHAKAGGES